MSYQKAECPECKQKMMASGGVIPPHTIRGTNIPCDGVGDTIETAVADDVDEAEASETAMVETNQPQTPSEETDMPEKVEVDLKRLEELAAAGKNKSGAAKD